MKLLQIAALALCLTIPMIRAGGNGQCELSAPITAIATLDTLSTVADVYGTYSQNPARYSTKRCVALTTGLTTMVMINGLLLMNAYNQCTSTPCLNIPMAHAGGEVSEDYTYGQVAGATTVIAASLYGYFKAFDIVRLKKPSLAPGLVYVGSLLAITGTAQVAINTLECPAVLVDSSYNASCTAIATVGLGLIAAGKYLENK